jgi:hypothetical protein
MSLKHFRASLWLPSAVGLVLVLAIAIVEIVRRSRKDMQDQSTGTDPDGSSQEQGVHTSATTHQSSRGDSQEINPDDARLMPQRTRTDEGVR